MNGAILYSMASRLEAARGRLLAALERFRRSTGIPNRIVTTPSAADAERTEELIERFGWNHLRERKRRN